MRTHDYRASDGSEHTMRYLELSDLRIGARAHGREHAARVPGDGEAHWAVRVQHTTPHYGRNLDGYGRKIPTRYSLAIASTDAIGRKTIRMHRVYVVCYSNSGSMYVVLGGQDTFLDTAVEHAIETAALSADSGESTA
jgi:hypothetical protein